MKNKQFQALLDDLGGLTPIQQAALTTALKTNGSADDVISLLEAEFDKAPGCGHCGSESFARWGAATGMRRYKCKARIRRFSALTGTTLAHLQKREKWLDYARGIVDGLTLRKAAARVGVHLETSFRWRHRFLATSKKAKPKRFAISSKAVANAGMLTTCFAARKGIASDRYCFSQPNNCHKLKSWRRATGLTTAPGSGASDTIAILVWPGRFRRRRCARSRLTRSRAQRRWRRSTRQRGNRNDEGQGVSRDAPATTWLD